CPEHKNIAVMWLNKVVTELVHKHLVASVDCASGNDFATMKNPTGENVEVLTQRVRRRIHQKALALKDQSRKGKKQADFSRDNFQKLVVLTGYHIDVIAAPNNKLRDLSHKIRRRLGAGMTDNPI